MYWRDYMNRISRIADLSMIWKQVSMIFPYFDQRKIDWDSAYLEYLPKVLNAETDRDFHLLLAEFMNLIGDGHTDYQFPMELRNQVGHLPFVLRYIRGDYYIDASTPEYQTFLGAKVLSINGAPFGELVEQAKKYSYHVGNYLSRYRLNQILPFLLPLKENVAETSLGSFRFQLLPKRYEGFTPIVLNHPAPYQSLQAGKLDIRLYDGGILFVKLDDFMYSGAADEIQAVISSTPGIAGILFDLRENVGGMTMNGAKIAQLLIPGQFHGCRKRTRSMTGIGLSSASQIMHWSEEEINRHIAAGLSTREEIEESMRFVKNTHYDAYVDTYGAEGHTPLYSGPCVILTSRHTVSAAEDFLAMFRTNDRATIVGTPTCGTTGTPYMHQLSCGGWMRVCSVGYRLMDGTEFIGCGIQPDIYSEISADDYIRRYDSVLDQGLALLIK